MTRTVREKTWGQEEHASLWVQGPCPQQRGGQARGAGLCGVDTMRSWSGAGAWSWQNPSFRCLRFFFFFIIGIWKQGHQLRESGEVVGPLRGAEMRSRWRASGLERKGDGQGAIEMAGCECRRAPASRLLSSSLHP